MTQRILRALARWVAAVGARIAWLLTMPLLPRRRSSITDNGWWSNFCGRNAADDRRFARFRRMFRHRLIVEATPPAEARGHLARVLRQTPHYRALFDKFLTLDRLGAPRMTEFARDVWFAPSTARYMRYLSDCETRFGYIHRNEISSYFDAKSLRLAEIEAALPAKLEIEKDDMTYWYDRTDILAWDERRRAAAA